MERKPLSDEMLMKLGLFDTLTGKRSEIRRNRAGLGGVGEHFETVFIFHQRCWDSVSQGSN